MSRLPDWLADPALQSAWDRILDRFEAAGLQAHGRVAVRVADRVQKHAVGALLGRTVTRDTVRIDLAVLDERLWVDFGVHPDLLSRTCLVWGLRPVGGSSVAARLRMAADAGEHTPAGSAPMTRKPLTATERAHRQDEAYTRCARTATSREIAKSAHPEDGSASRVAVT